MKYLTIAYFVMLSLGAILVTLTMYARLDDIPAGDNRALTWIRKLSMMLVIGCCVTIAFLPLAGVTPFVLKSVLLGLIWGTFGVYFTSPHQKPWFEFITGAHREGADTFCERFSADVNAVRRGFSRRGNAERRSGEDRRKSP